MVADIFILFLVLSSQIIIFRCIDSTAFILYGSRNRLFNLRSAVLTEVPCCSPQSFQSNYNIWCLFCRVHQNGNFIARKNLHPPRHLTTAAVMRETKRWAARTLIFTLVTITSRNLTFEFPPLQYCQWTLCDFRNSESFK